jgi:hypothetical protein
MKTASLFFMAMFITGVGLFLGGGCSKSLSRERHVTMVNNPNLPESQSPPTPIVEPIDLETFSAFCDRA